MSVQNTNLTQSTSPGGDAAVQGANRSRRSQETQSTHRGSGAAAARATDSSEDDVQLSSAARQIETLKATANADSFEHQARVAELSKVYSAGTYASDPHATAAGIVSEAIDSHGSK